MNPNHSQTTKYVIATLLLVCLCAIVFFIVKNKITRETGSGVKYELTEEELKMALEKLTPKGHVSLMSKKEEEKALKNLSVTLEKSLLSKEEEERALKSLQK